MYLLCIDCWRAWFAAPGEPTRCDLCGAEAVACSPYGSADTWNWYAVRVRDKVGGIHEVLTTSTRSKRRTLARAARARGREMYIGRAA